MSSTIWGPWEDIRTKGEVKTENQDKGYKKQAFRGSATACYEPLRLFFANQSWKNYVITTVGFTLITPKR